MNVSDRSAASMIEIDQTVSTWPQLAGEVVAGRRPRGRCGAAHPAGQPCPSGRYHLDIDRALDIWSRRRPVATGVAARRRAVPPPLGRPGRRSGRRSSSRRSSRRRLAHPRPATPALAVRLGRAPAARVARPSTRPSAIDPGCAAGWIAVGAACENSPSPPATGDGQRAFTWFPDRADPDLAAVVTFVPRRARPRPDCSRLFPLIAERCTDRTVGRARPLSGTQRRALRGSGRRHGASSTSSTTAPTGALRHADRGVGSGPDAQPDAAPRARRELRWTARRRPVAPTASTSRRSRLSRPAWRSCACSCGRPWPRFLAEHDLGGRLGEIQRGAIDVTTALARDGVGATPSIAFAAAELCNGCGWRPPPTAGGTPGHPALTVRAARR